MGRFYYAAIDADTITAAQGIFELRPATDDPVRLWAFEIGNITEAGDSEEEQLELHLIRRTGSPSSGSGGNLVTAANKPGATQDAAATTATVRENDTTEASAGTAQIVMRIGWNLRVPYTWTAPHEGAAIQVKDNDLITLDLITVPADTFDLVGWICYEEV